MTNTDPRERIIVAMDCSRERANELAELMSEDLVWAKVGMEIFYSEGAQIVRDMKERGLKVFLDLKLHDIPNTVRNAARVLATLGVDMVTVHSQGGTSMVAAAREGLEEGSQSLGLERPRLLAVTMLTSIDQGALDELGVGQQVGDYACHLAKLTHEAGADGVVCSPIEASRMREILGAEALVVTPGVRPQGSDVGDQARVATPARAIASGSSHLVIGRPITKAPDPKEAMRAIVEEVRGALA